MLTPISIAKRETRRNLAMDFCNRFHKQLSDQLCHRKRYLLRFTFSNDHLVDAIAISEHVQLANGIVIIAKNTVKWNRPQKWHHIYFWHWTELNVKSLWFCLQIWKNNHIIVIQYLFCRLSLFKWLDQPIPTHLVSKFKGHSSASPDMYLIFLNWIVYGKYWLIM